MQPRSTGTSRPQAGSGRLFEAAVTATKAQAPRPPTSSSRTSSTGGSSSMTTASGPSRAAPASAYKATTGRGGVPQPLQTMGSQAPQQAPTSARTGMRSIGVQTHASSSSSGLPGCAPMQSRLERYSIHLSLAQDRFFDRLRAEKRASEAIFDMTPFLPELEKIKREILERSPVYTARELISAADGAGENATPGGSSAMSIDRTLPSASVTIGSPAITSSTTLPASTGSLRRRHSSNMSCDGRESKRVGRQRAGQESLGGAEKDATKDVTMA